MNIDSIEFRGYRCFTRGWTGFKLDKPINVILGRNNAGKSQLLDLLQSICKGGNPGMAKEHRYSTILGGKQFERSFRENRGVSSLSGDFWEDHGKHFVGKRASWAIDDRGSITEFECEGLDPKDTSKTTQGRILNIKATLEHAHIPLMTKCFKRLSADRDIRVEESSVKLDLQPNGSGATNLIRRYELSSRLDRALIRTTLLEALNEVFASDGHFTEIGVQIHDVNDGSAQQHFWEIRLAEDGKGLIALSHSGSGLKTVILVLLHLLVIPEVEHNSKDAYVFAFEELENNLHPALLRRLLQYLERYVLAERAILFLTTHSSVALDYFGQSKNAQMIHVLHNGNSAVGKPISAHFDRVGVVTDLGAKPSDLLQANGIIWVEGPSDRIYLNRWIELYGDEALREGRHYQCAFYGGSLLARTQFCPEEEAMDELVNLLRLNFNIVVVCDGDQTGPEAPLKARVQRIVDEVGKIPNGYVWVTEAREIENYLPGQVVGAALKRTSVPDPGQYEPFFPHADKSNATSFVERNLSGNSLDKMELAHLTVPHMTKATLDSRFELPKQLNQIVTTIRKWND